METVGQRIAAARGAKGWTQGDLAKAVGKAPQQISAWERSDGPPRMPNLMALLDELGVRKEWLLVGEGSMFPATQKQPAADATATTFDHQLIGLCAGMVIESLLGAKTIPPASKLGAVVLEIYHQCKREEKQPTAKLVTPFVRILLA